MGAAFFLVIRGLFSCAYKINKRCFALKLIIVEGLFPGSLLEEVADINVFIDAELDLALARRIERDVAERGRTAESVRAH